MSKRPIYMKPKGRSYGLMIAICMVFVWFVWGYSPQPVFDGLIEKSELKGRSFTGKTEKIVSKKTQTEAYFMGLKETPLVSISFIFDGAGTAYDAEDKQGVSALAASSMLFGAEDLTTEILDDELGTNGIKISFAADNDVFSGKITVPVENLAKATALMRKILSKPRFEKKYVVTAIKNTLKVFDAEKESPERMLAIALNKALYGKHPYARHPLGTKESVALLTPKDLKDFVVRRLNRANLFVGIAGAVSKEQAEVLTDEMFGFLPQGNKAVKVGKAALHLEQSPLTLPYVGGQIIAGYAAKGTCRKCDDFYPLYIANYLFGGAGLNSELNQRMREKEGLTYGAYSVLENNEAADVLKFGFSATPDNFVKAEKLLIEEWKKVANEGFDAQKVQAAKDFLTASYNLRFASTAQIAGMLAYMQKEDLGLDFLQKRNNYVKNVTLQQVNKAAKVYFGKNVLSVKIGKVREKQ